MDDLKEQSISCLKYSFVFIFIVAFCSLFISFLGSSAKEGSGEVGGIILIIILLPALIFIPLCSFYYVFVKRNKRCEFKNIRFIFAAVLWCGYLVSLTWESDSSPYVFIYQIIYDLIPLGHSGSLVSTFFFLLFCHAIMIPIIVLLSYITGRWVHLRRK